MVDNGPRNLIKSYVETAAMYTIYSKEVAAKLQLVLYVLLPLTIVTSLVLFFAFFLPTLKRIQSERRRFLQLFMEIPKETSKYLDTLILVSRIQTALSAELQDEDEDEDTDLRLQIINISSQDVGKINEKSMLRKGTVSFLVSIGVLLVVVGALFGVSLYYALTFSERAPELNYGPYRRFQVEM